MKESQYVTACGKCGEPIYSHEPTGKCPNCGVEFEMHWQYSSGQEKKKN